MEKGWVKVKTLQAFEDLINEKEELEDCRLFWDKVLKEFKVDYKYDLSSSNQVFYLDLYVRNTDELKVKEFFNKLDDEPEYENSPELEGFEPIPEDYDEEDEYEDDEEEKEEKPKTQKEIKENIAMDLSVIGWLSIIVIFFIIGGLCLCKYLIDSKCWDLLVFAILGTLASVFLVCLFIRKFIQFWKYDKLFKKDGE